MDIRKKITNSRSAIQKIPEFKMKILNRVLESDDLVKLIAYDSPDALFRDNLTQEQKGNLLYNRMYPYRFMTDIVEQQGTWLTLGASYFRSVEIGYDVYDDYQAGELYFYFFTHVDLMKTDAGVRQDLMLGEIDSLFNGSRGLGMGELKMRNANELWMHNNKFGGYAVGFTVSDLK